MQTNIIGIQSDSQSFWIQIRTYALSFLISGELFAKDMSSRHWKINTLKAPRSYRVVLKTQIFRLSLINVPTSRIQAARRLCLATLAILARMSFHCSYMQYVSKYHVIRVNSAYSPKMLNVYISSVDSYEMALNVVFNENQHSALLALVLYILMDYPIHIYIKSSIS